MPNRFALVPGSAHQAAFYWEPSVDGDLLRHLLRLSWEEQLLDTARLGPVGKNVPVLVHSWPVGMTPDVCVLLGEHPSDLPDGRAPLYVCVECGDLGCGVVSAVIERTATTVVWRDFRWDDGRECDPRDDTSISGGPFVFDRHEYEAELRRFVSTFDSVRESLPPGVIAPPRAAQDARRRHWPHRWPWSPR